MLEKLIFYTNSMDHVSFKIFKQICRLNLKSNLLVY